MCSECLGSSWMVERPRILTKAEACVGVQLASLSQWDWKADGTKGSGAVS